MEFDTQGAFLKVGEHCLYDIVRSRRPETHELKLVTDADDLCLYTYTFG